MQLDPQLRERILRNLRWVVPEMTTRFDDCKGNIDGFEGGYSDELKDLIALKQELEQGDLPLQTTAIAAPPFFSEQECLDMGISIGMKFKQSIEFYLHYGKQGWKLGNGLPIVDLRLAMRAWHLKQEDKIEGKSAKLRLFPLAGGKICGEPGCGLPAVHKTSGAYDHWFCATHIPEKIKVKMREAGYDL